MTNPIQVTIWNEFRHERENEAVKKIYPAGIHTLLAEVLGKQPGISCQTATQDEPEHGLPDEVINNTDVMLWWGHAAHDEVDDAIVKKVHQRVVAGMGLIVLHSGHYSKIFRSLMGTHCSLTWREAAEKERLWNLEPGHPITQGIGPYIELPHTEMYGERFDIPTPDKLIFISWFEGGEVFRSGCCWDKGHGRIFYFRPGHETFPIYYDENVQKVIVNAVRWARPTVILPDVGAPNVEPIEKLSEKNADFGKAGMVQEMD